MFKLQLIFSHRLPKFKEAIKKELKSFWFSITPDSRHVRTKESPARESKQQNPDPDPIEITSEGRNEPKSLQVDAFPGNRFRTFVKTDNFSHTIC